MLTRFSPSRLGRRLRRRLRTGDDGFVLPTVLMVSLAMSLLIAATIDFAVGQMPQARENQDHHAALQAAEAGIDEYISRLNTDTNYWQAVDAANPAYSGWVDLPGGSVNDAEFQYQLDNSTTPTDGIIRLKVRGKVGDEERTLSVNLARKNFTDYVYFSDLEVNDPLNFTKYVDKTVPQQTTNAANCSRYAWRTGAQARASSPSCATIGWVANDIVRGKLHTNDLLIVGGGVFEGIPESGCTITAPCGDTGGNGNKKFYTGGGGTFLADPNAGGYGGKSGYGVIGGGILPFPPSNEQIAVQARTPNQGCMYTGPTRIILKGTRMDVYSPNSRNTNGPGCGVMDASGKALNLQYPRNGVIFVQNIPTSTSDPNYRPTASVPCTRPYLPGPKPNKSPAQYRSNPNNTTLKTVPNGFPLVEDQFDYGCTTADVFIEGTYDTQLTVASADDIFLTSDVLAADRTTGLLGIVAQNTVWNYHPVNGKNTTTGGTQARNCNGNMTCSWTTSTPWYDMCAGACMQDVQIDAALMSVTHGYGTAYPDVGGNYGIIHLYGSLVQKWRNNVGGGSASYAVDPAGSGRHSGYGKDYAYNERLRFLQPPHFLSPLSTQWGVNSWSEVKNP